jgi:hypothetical protein
MAKATSQITFRLPSETHSELLEVCGHLGIDMTALLNQIVAESLPGYLDRAREKALRHRQSRAALDEVAVTGEHPLVRELVAFGRRTKAPPNLDKIIEHALLHHKSGDPPVESVVRVALDIVSRLDYEDQVRERTKELLSERLKKSAGAGEQTRQSSRGRQLNAFEFFEQEGAGRPTPKRKGTGKTSNGGDE